MEVDVLKRIAIAEQEPQVRAKNFEEVCLGYNLEEAQSEKDVRMFYLILKDLYATKVKTPLFVENFFLTFSCQHRTWGYTTSQRVSFPSS